MSTILCFFRSILAQSRRLQQSGQITQSIVTLSRLVGFADLPADVAAEAHARLGELHLKRRRHAKARRHLRAALALAPDSARLHQRLGQCHAGDPEGSLDLARRHYRRALDLEPSRPRWRAEAGLLAVRAGRTDEGVGLLLQARHHAPDDVGILGRLVKGLCQAGRPDEALRVVRLARFASPRCEKVRKLEADLLLADVRRDQEQATARRREDPAVLPFTAPAPAAAKKEIRHDGRHSAAGPHLVKMPVRAGRRSS